jgi:hypothetical protein
MPVVAMAVVLVPVAAVARVEGEPAEPAEGLTRNPRLQIPAGRTRTGRMWIWRRRRLGASAPWIHTRIQYSNCGSLNTE